MTIQAQVEETETESIRPLLFALPKGRLTDDCFSFLAKAGLSLPAGADGRKLVLQSADGRFGYVMAKPWDVPTYVEYGAADLGICGLDVLRESGRAVHEPLLLPFGRCRLSVAGPADRPDVPLRYESQPRIATKFPRLASQFFRERGINAEVITLAGSVELGPVLGITDLIVDVVETGRTLRANGLVEFRTILESQAVLIANRASYRLRADVVQEVIERLRGVI